MDDGGGDSVDRSGVPAGKVSVRRHADQRYVFLLVLAFPGVLVGSGGLCARLFRSGGAGVGVGYWDWGEFGGASLPAALPQTGSDGGTALVGAREGGGGRGGCGRDQL